MDTISRFLQMRSKEHQKYLKRQRNGITVYSCESGQWCGNKIRVVKIFDNLFLVPNVRDIILEDIKCFQNNKNLYKDMDYPTKEVSVLRKTGLWKDFDHQHHGQIYGLRHLQAENSRFYDSKTLFEAVKYT